MNAPIDARAFRTALGAFATGVTVVTMRRPNGEPVGNTVNSFSALSLEPPLVLWSLGKRANSFKSYLSTDHFAVNILREGQEDISHRFSRSLARVLAWRLSPTSPIITACNQKHTILPFPQPLRSGRPTGRMVGNAHAQDRTKIRIGVVIKEGRRFGASPASLPLSQPP
jgi:hypothetical protein